MDAFLTNIQYVSKARLSGLLQTEGHFGLCQNSIAVTIQHSYIQILLHPTIKPQNPTEIILSLGFTLLEDVIMVHRKPQPLK